LSKNGVWPKVTELKDAKELVERRGGTGGGGDARVKRGSRREQIAKEQRVPGVQK
jgi:hypothetical protein